jgi:hypothetical protein
MIDFDLTTAKEMIATEYENLKTYIKEKNEFYNKTRARRIKNKKASTN